MKHINKMKKFFIVLDKKDNKFIGIEIDTCFNFKKEDFKFKHDIERKYLVIQYLNINNQIENYKTSFDKNIRDIFILD